jgi:hypothetical protein
MFLRKFVPRLIILPQYPSSNARAADFHRRPTTATSPIRPTASRLSLFQRFHSPARATRPTLYPYLENHP